MQRKQNRRCLNIAARNRSHIFTKGLIIDLKGLVVAVSEKCKANL